MNIVFVYTIKKLLNNEIIIIEYVSIYILHVNHTLARTITMQSSNQNLRHR